MTMHNTLKINIAIITRKRKRKGIINRCITIFISINIHINAN